MKIKRIVSLILPLLTFNQIDSMDLVKKVIVENGAQSAILVGTGAALGFGYGIATNYIYKNFNAKTRCNLYKNALVGASLSFPIIAASMPKLDSSNLKIILGLSPVCLFIEEFFLYRIVKDRWNCKNKRSREYLGQTSPHMGNKIGNDTDEDFQNSCSNCIRGLIYGCYGSLFLSAVSLRLRQN
jgi:hypothetical protein